MKKDIKRKLTPLQAIRQHCLECSAGNKSEVRNCIIVECPLYPFRMGKNPNRAGIGNPKAVIKKNIS